MSKPPPHNGQIHIRSTAPAAPPGRATRSAPAAPAPAASALPALIHTALIHTCSQARQEAARRSHLVRGARLRLLVAPTPPPRRCARLAVWQRRRRPLLRRTRPTRLLRNQEPAASQGPNSFDGAPQRLSLRLCQHAHDRSRARSGCMHVSPERSWGRERACFS